MGAYSDGIERAVFWSISSRAARVLGVRVFMEIEVYEKAMYLQRGVQVHLYFLIHTWALMGISLIKKDRSSRLKKTKVNGETKQKTVEKMLLIF